MCTKKNSVRKQLRNKTKKVILGILRVIKNQPTDQLTQHNEE